MPTSTQVQAPTLGRIVMYRSKLGDGIVSPAIVTVTKDTWRESVRAAAHDAPLEEITSETEMAPTAIPEPDNEYSVSLTVFGASSRYVEHNVPHSMFDKARTWFWPEIRSEVTPAT